MKQTNKNLPLNRPPLNDIEELEQCEEEKLNFEFYMNREYAYNRDGGKCKRCDGYIHSEEIPKGIDNSNQENPKE